MGKKDIIQTELTRLEVIGKELGEILEAPSSDEYLRLGIHQAERKLGSSECFELAAVWLQDPTTISEDVFDLMVYLDDCVEASNRHDQSKVRRNLIQVSEAFCDAGIAVSVLGSVLPRFPSRVNELASILIDFSATIDLAMVSRAGCIASTVKGKVNAVRKCISVHCVTISLWAAILHRSTKRTSPKARTPRQDRESKVQEVLRAVKVWQQENQTDRWPKRETLRHCMGTLDNSDFTAARKRFLENGLSE